MDRPYRSLFVAGGLGLILAASGCRSPRAEVPPGRQYMNDGRQVPPVGFSSTPHSPASAGLPGDPTMPGNGTSTPYSTPPSSMSGYGAPTSHGYGAPSTSSTVPGAPTSSSSSMPAYGGPSTPAGATADPAASQAGM